MKIFNIFAVLMVGFVLETKPAAAGNGNTHYSFGGTGGVCSSIAKGLKKAASGVFGLGQKVAPVVVGTLPFVYDEWLEEAFGPLGKVVFQSLSLGIAGGWVTKRYMPERGTSGGHLPAFLKVAAATTLVAGGVLSGVEYFEAPQDPGFFGKAKSFIGLGDNL